MKEPMTEVPICLIATFNLLPTITPMTPPTAAARRVIFWSYTWVNFKIMRATAIPSQKAKTGIAQSLTRKYAAIEPTIPKMIATTRRIMKCIMSVVS